MMALIHSASKTYQFQKFIFQRKCPWIRADHLSLNVASATRGKSNTRYSDVSFISCINSTMYAPLNYIIS